MFCGVIIIISRLVKQIETKAEGKLKTQRCNNRGNDNENENENEDKHKDGDND